VADRITELFRETGGFGYLLITSYDSAGAAGEQEAWERSLRLLTGEVLPACRRACRGVAHAPSREAA